MFVPFGLDPGSTSCLTWEDPATGELQQRRYKIGGTQDLAPYVSRLTAAYQSGVDIGGDIKAISGTDAVPVVGIEGPSYKSKYQQVVTAQQNALIHFGVSNGHTGIKVLTIAPQSMHKFVCGHGGDYTKRAGKSRRPVRKHDVISCLEHIADDHVLGWKPCPDLNTDPGWLSDQADSLGLQQMTGAALYGQDGCEVIVGPAQRESLGPLDKQMEAIGLGDLCISRFTSLPETANI